MRADAARQLLPGVRDEAWFFDTELLMLAQRSGLRIHEVPVDWVDDPDSRVDVWRTALDDLRGIVRLLASARLTRFAVVGVCSTLAYGLLFLALRGPLGVALANAIALAVTAIGNTQANRWLTFGLRGREGLIRQHVMGAFVYVLTLGLTVGALGLLRAIDPSPSRAVELAVLLVASASATVTRYIALRTWVFARDRRPGAVPAHGGIRSRARGPTCRAPLALPISAPAHARAAWRDPSCGSCSRSPPCSTCGR